MENKKNIPVIKTTHSRYIQLTKTVTKGPVLSVDSDCHYISNQTNNYPDSI